MKASDLLDMIGNTDDDIIKEAKKRKKPVVARWTRWIAVAACLCLIVAAVVEVPRFKNTNPSGTQEHQFSDSSGALAHQIFGFGIDSKTVLDPVFIEQNEMPMIRQSDLLDSINNNITVQGTLSLMDTVRIKDNDSIWFLTTAVISVDEVITGKYDSDEVHIVCAACYTGVPIDENTVPIPCLTGCQENTFGVFVLHGLDNGTWTICGKEVLPKSLGDYYVVYYLERSGDVLTYTPQRISVSVNDIIK